MKIKALFLSWDFVVTVVATIVIWRCCPEQMKSETAKDMYGVGITVLSITFSVYFAALALVISSSSDDFVNFLEERGGFTSLVNTFTFALYVLFLALTVSLFFYGLAAIQLSLGNMEQSKWMLVVFVALFFYSLFVVIRSAKDAILFAKTRTRYMRVKSAEDKDRDDSGAEA
jgi:hypothetical protein